jgi:hypothetical protein
MAERAVRDAAEPDELDPDELVRFIMSMPRHLHDAIFAAEEERAKASMRRPSVAAWMREAASAKLAGDGRRAR